LSDRSDVGNDHGCDNDEGWAVDAGAIAFAWFCAIALFVGCAKSGGTIR